MAATDKAYRDQYKLDIVFAVSSILMLISVMMMFMQDYYREFKDEQRVFRDVESRLAQRIALEQIPSDEELDAAEKAIEDAKAKRQEDEPKVRELRKEIEEKRPTKEKLEATVQGIKADQESILSFYYIEIEHHGTGSRQAAEYKKQLEKIGARLDEASAERDRVQGEMMLLQQKADAYDADLTRKVGELKKINDRFDTSVKQSIAKEWTWGDWIRTWPIIDGFASPTRIQQYTNNDLPINYNFKEVTRFDRCTTCHLAIDRPAYTPRNLHSLVSATPDQEEKLALARAQLRERRSALSGLPDAKQVPDPKQLQLTTMSDKRLTEARIRQFTAHPRLDLFVTATSKHPAEKFGCTACHQGQGSSTSFQWASHTPNDSITEHKWTNEHGWSHIHSGDWEFPMLPQRFIESSCLKCHHQVTDLIAADNRNEAPKVLRGYNLIKEVGCFGCHEIAGRKGGRSIGPDLRLESTPPLDDLTATERSKIESDLDNRPGNLRKVGPSLYRLAEKTNEDFTRKWIRAPREFRPDTKMPHFYGLSNNHPDNLPDEQKKLPDTEIHAITYYLFQTSNAFLKDVDQQGKSDGEESAAKDRATVAGLVSLTQLSDSQRKELDDARRRMRLRQAKTLKDLTGGHAGDPAQGRTLFLERGCLACHVHQATEKGEAGTPPIIGESVYGPNLSQVAEKLGKKVGDKKSAQLWLVQWLLDPKVHSPRSRMPVTHLTEHQAADVAAWLLSQPATDHGSEWKGLKVAEPETKDLEDLARVYLVRQLSKADLKRFFETRSLDANIANDLPADDKNFVLTYKDRGNDALLMYVGKKGVGRQGCYACHDVPGFDNAKSIGVGLNDWGKKDGSRLAFEDIQAYVDSHHYVVDKMVDENGNPYGPRQPRKVREDEAHDHGHGHAEDGKPVVKTPYEKYFYESLLGQNRQGYLNQKLMEPRSYDYNRFRAWDDRARMPQFRFSRLRKKAGESEADFQARSIKEEADAREAVMTFILGLTAEAVPEKMLNLPKGDRLAEVKGRQVLDTYNCGGCHLIRPGSFELKIDDKLRTTLTKAATAKRAGDHVFPNHHYWTGKPPEAADRVVAHGILPQPPLSADEEDEKVVRLRLMEALRFQGEDRRMLDIPTATTLNLEPKDFIYPRPEVFESPESLHRYLRDRGQYGGVFADLLVGWLEKKDAKKYTRDPGLGDSSPARPLAPPSLVGLGEKGQPEWVYEFLLNPYQIRPMTLLRMPKFSLSDEDARALVDYFAAVERQTNSGAGLSYPFETGVQQLSLDSGYFRQKAAEYSARLKTVKVSEGGKTRTMYEKRVEELTPVWQATLKDYEGQKSAADSRKTKAEQRYKTAFDAEEKAKKAQEAAKSKKEGIAEADAAYKTAKSALDEATRAKDAWERESARLASMISQGSVKQQEEAWAQQEAYLTDAFRLVLNNNLCIKCHSLATVEVKNEIMGPRLDEVHHRLRPGWTERWIANPMRHLPYSSSMPAYFPADEPNQFQEFFAGAPADRAQAVRDVLMVFPQASRLPANRAWMLPQPGDVK